MDITMVPGGKENIGGFLELSLFVLLIVGFNPELNTQQDVWWGIILLTIVNTVLIIIKKEVPVINRYFIWMLLFFFWSTVSYFWSLDRAVTFDILKTLLVNLVILWLISSVIQTERDVIQLLRLVVAASVFNGVYMLLQIDISLLGNLQLGEYLLGDKWNGNLIGIMMAFSMLISMVLFNRAGAFYEKALYIIIIIFSVSVALLTGSRKALFFVAFGYAAYTGISSKRNKLVIAMQLILLLLVGYYAIMNIPLLYNVLGVRLEGLQAAVTGVGDIDGSTEQRMLYMSLGTDWIKKSPLYGYGLDNYRILLYDAIGKSTYSHNNYVEILVGLGIVGLFIHYTGIIYVLINLVKLARSKWDDLVNLFVVMFAAILAAMYGFVTYYDFLVNLVFCLGFVLLRIREREPYE